MKKKLLFLLTLVAIGLSNAWGYDFSAVAPSGQRLYYNITRGNAEVTYQYSSSPRYYSNLTGALVIPASVTSSNGTTYSVTSIGIAAFSNCSGLTSVTIPNSVTAIGGDAFHGCTGLTSVTIPDSVTSIGQYAFYGCSGLTSVTIPNSVTSIGSYAFEYCSGLTSVTIPNSVTTIEDGAFSNCSGLTSVTIPNSVTTIGYAAFYDCSGLTSVTIGNSLTTIGYGAFCGCSGLTSVTIPNSVTSIGDYAFDGCSSLTSVTIPNSVTTIGEKAFSGCSGLTSIVVETGNTHYDSRNNCNAIIETGTNTLICGCMNTTISNSVTSIGNYAFYHCSGLTSVTIPNSVTSIGVRAFYNCSSLTSVTMRGTVPPTLGGSVFSGNADNRKIYVPCGAYDNYYNANNGWSAYENVLSDPNMDIDVMLNTDTERGSVSFIPLHNQNVRCDSTVVVSATPNYGYHFDHWSTGSTQAQDTIAVSGETVITAYFAKNQYTIVLLSDDASLGSMSGGGTFDYLDTITLMATPIDHHHLVRWSDGNRENPRQWVVTSDTTLTAYFAIDTHRVTVVSSDISRGMVEASGTEFVYGNPCTVTATAYTGFTFACWSNGVTANPYTFAVMNDVELTAMFLSEGEQLFTVTVVSNDPTMGSVSGGGMAMSGGEVTIHAVANEGYHFVRWNDNDTNADRTVIVTEDATYTAYFASDQTDGIDEVEQMAEVYVNGGCIVVSGAQDMNLTIYDVVGRLIVREKAIEGKQYPMPHTGVYVVRIGHYPAQKVVVIK